MRRIGWLAMVLLCTLGLVAQAEIVRDTAFGRGADTYLSNDSQQSPNSNMGTESRMRAWRQLANTRSKVGYIRFDIDKASGSMSGAYLTLAYTYMKGGASTVNVYGLNDGPDDFWIESGTGGITYNTAPGLLPTTLGNSLVDTSKATLLGTLTSLAAATLPVSVSSNPATLNLQPFLEADTNGVVTIFFIGPNDEDEIATKENTTHHAPRLTMPNASLGAAFDPEPAEDAIVNRFALTELSWSLLPEVAKIDIYFGTEPNTLKMDKLSFDPAVTSVSIDSFPSYSTPLADGTYYWRIDGLDAAPVDPNVLVGPFWSFTSPSVPIVPVDQPADVRVFPADPAVLTVNFSSFYAPTVKWFKDDNTTVTEITTGTATTNNGGGDFTATLTLAAPVSVSAEGQYYCEVSNDGGTTWHRSGVGNLIVKRQLAQYAFNGNLTDSSGNGAPEGTALDTQGDPNSLNAVPASISYVAGVDGAADAAIYLAVNQYVDFGVEGYPKANAFTSNGFGGGMDEGTIVFWVKSDVTSALQTVWGNFNDGTTNGFAAQIQADQDFDLFVRGDGGVTLANHPAGRPNRPEFNLTDGNWHMMAACWSGNTSTLYVDGQWVVNGTGIAPASYSAWQYGVMLGAVRAMANRYQLTDMFQGGAIDNLRIYNYRLDADSIAAFAQEYLDYTGVRPCINMSFAESAYNFDNTGDSYCKVDLADFADFAAAWLGSGLY
jgi:hypothetical protein